MKSFPNGCAGFTTAVASIIPRSCAEFWKYGTCGATRPMLDTYENLIRPIIAIRSVARGCEIGGIKVALEALGRFGGPTRLPEPPVAEAAKEVIVDILKKHPETKNKVLG